jgi:hypothetical protein
MKEYIVNCPNECSFITQPELAITFFKAAKTAYEAGGSVQYNLKDVTSFCETAAAVLMAFIKDRKINKGLPSKIIWPDDIKVRERLISYGIQKKISQNDISDVEVRLEPIKVTESKVANLVAKDLVDTTSNILFGEPRKIKELYAILIEMMANTNNHASKYMYNVPSIIKKVAADDAGSEVVKWWLFSFYDVEKHAIKYVFIDFGVGMFESLPVKQFIQRVPVPIISFDSGNEVRLQKRRVELAHMFENLVAGRISSSTGDPSRGRGIPLIADCASSHMFSQFNIIANDAYVDLKKRVAAAMNEHFSGTLFHFELLGRKP